MSMWARHIQIPMKSGSTYTRGRGAVRDHLGRALEAGDFGVDPHSGTFATAAAGTITAAAGTFTGWLFGEPVYLETPTVVAGWARVAGVNGDGSVLTLAEIRDAQDLVVSLADAGSAAVVVERLPKTIGLIDRLPVDADAMVASADGSYAGWLGLVKVDLGDVAVEVEGDTPRYKDRLYWTTTGRVTADPAATTRRVFAGTCLRPSEVGTGHVLMRLPID